MNTNSDSPQNDAVERCNRARLRAYNKELANIKQDQSDYPAEKAGNKAYLRSLPPLSGYQNICDFIACIANGMAVDAIRPADADRLLAAAKIAVGAVRHEPAALNTRAPKLSSGGQDLLHSARELSKLAATEVDGR
jgi:hypothetical protein